VTKEEDEEGRDLLPLMVGGGLVIGSIVIVAVFVMIRSSSSRIKYSEASGDLNLHDTSLDGDVPVESYSDGVEMAGFSGGTRYSDTPEEEESGAGYLPPMS